MKRCFICGTLKDLTVHHIVPKRIHTKIAKKDNQLPVCKKCHMGIHNATGKLYPGHRLWHTIAKKAAKLSNPNQWQNFLREVIQISIVERSHSILLYKEFLEFQEWKKERGY